MARREGALELRRSPHLILYWRQRRAELHDYATGRTIHAPKLILEVLDHFDAWRAIDSYVAAAPKTTRAVARQLVLELHRQGFLLRRGAPKQAAEIEMGAWSGWNPAAGFFHSKTRNNIIVDVGTAIANVRRRQRTHTPPPPVKTYAGAARVVLPAVRAAGPFPATLRARRTWRRFSDRPVALQSVATLLQLTAGVQHWITARGEGRVAMKTSPSGGARHPIEVYLLARHVSSLEAGVYHYAADAHALERLPMPGALPPFDTFLPTQWWYRDAAALVLFTAVFARTRWRYRGPRAYRAVLLEAGHVCQTFCLTATWLGLAPFCSMALSDAAIEQALHIDGISESVLYAAGVGGRPTLKTGEAAGAFPRRTAKS